jgi:nucleoside 2-deoxyribosyltransferase
MLGMKLYITARFKAAENKQDIEKLCQIVHDTGYEDFCFIRDIEQYQFTFPDPHELMRRAHEELVKCDALLIDVSDQPTGGRIIEAGMAFGIGMPIIIIMKKGTPLKHPLRGIASHIIEYEALEDIRSALVALPYLQR